MKRMKSTGVPKFESLEEEREYWEVHGPLAEGYKSRISKSQARQKRSSFLAVRLTGEELTRLRDVAKEQGLGPSTFARLVLTRAIERKQILPPVVTIEKLMDTLTNNLSQTDRDKFESFVKAVAIGELDNPVVLEFSGARRTWEEVTSLFLTRLLASLGIQVVIPEKENIESGNKMAKRESIGNSL
jgi:antitoxin component of RelBE/YafQ-DinJ toxin-antitoxin module